MLVGAFVLSAIDDRDRSLYNWYDRCPPEIAWIMQPIILTAWPIILLIFGKNCREANSEPKDGVINGLRDGANEIFKKAKPLVSEYDAAVNCLMALTDEQRMDVFSLFCKSCGSNDQKCQCWNDE